MSDAGPSTGQTSQNGDKKPNKSRGSRGFRRGKGHKSSNPGGNIDSSLEQPAPSKTNGLETAPKQEQLSSTRKPRGRGGGAASSSRGRRGNFGSKVTADGNQRSGPAESAQSSLQAAAAVAALPVDATLQARLTHSLIVGERECSICVCSIGAKESIYSCPTCFAIDHLACVKDWASRSLADLRERSVLQPQLLIQWRCPSCNTSFPPKDLPVHSKCFCGRLKNPKFKPGQTPHSCGQSCARPRSCKHPCNLLCHPGPCEPCSVLVTTTCWCGKLAKDLRCSDSEVQQQRTCNQTCGRLLDCGLHKCQDTCHAGDCQSCTIQRGKSCYCGQDSLFESCFNPEHPPEDRMLCYGNDASSSWSGEFACQADCKRFFDCKIHHCDQPCHPHTQPELEHCPKAPDVLLRCPCGATEQPSRQACTDPIATCNSLCGATLDCEHACDSRCHTGAHPACSKPVTVVCRCGADKQEMPCFQANAPGFIYTCKRTCRAIRSCGKHECARQCCPLAFQEALLGKKAKKISLAELQALESQDEEGIHACPLTCGKMLSCGRHTCSRQDHRGPCGPCLASEFSEVSCHCGGTVLMPPVACGTQINCTLPCARPPPACGHPKVPHACHEDDVPCPPCTFLSDRQCACDKHLLVRNVRCSMTADKISCGTQCGKTLACGAHRDKTICHSGPCPPCSQRCGKPRKLCGHPHEAACHAPSACSTSLPCPAPVDVTCACGHIRQRALCGSCTAKPESAATRFLACTEACAVKKRNAALAEALGISSEAPRTGRLPAVYDEETLDFYSHSPNWCEQIEATLHSMLRSNRPSNLFQPMRAEQRHVVKNLAAAFQMKAQSLDAEPRRSVHVVKTPESAAPINSLSDSYTPKQRHPLISSNSNKVSTSQAVAPPPPSHRWNALLLKAVFGHDQDSLAETLQPALSFPFELKWVQEEDVLLLPLFPEGQSEANIESGLRSAKFVIQGISEVRSSEVLGCHVAGDTVVWHETKIQPSLLGASAWAKPRNATAQFPAKQSESTQSRWTALGATRASGSSSTTRPTTPLVPQPPQEVADSWDQYD